MRTSLRIRVLREGDLPFADSLRAVVGWNQTRTDWRRFLALQPGGCFLAEWDDAAAGTATTLVYGPELAWIGMVLVHPDYRRRGIGQALLRHCMDTLRQTGVRCIKLDATPLGKEVYDALGFRSQWTLTRWEHRGVGVAASAEPGLRPWAAMDLRPAGTLDRAAFGVSRERLLVTLVRDGRVASVLEDREGNLAGYGLLRAGARASYLGPVVASRAEDGLRLVRALLSAIPGEPVFWDIPDPNVSAVEWARQEGFTPQRTLTRMFLGEADVPGDANQELAIAGPEVG